jgi:hypothetical protein
VRKKIYGRIITVIVALSIASFSAPMPIVHARSDYLTLDGRSGPGQNGDCQASGPTVSCAAAIGLNTTRLNDVIVLALFADGMSVSQIIDRSSLNFIPRFERAGGQIAEYYAIAPSILTNDNTTVVFSAPYHALTFALTFAVAGANTKQIFDPSHNLPSETGCPPLSSCNLSIQTLVPQDFVFAITATGDNPTCATNGFSFIQFVGELEADYRISNTPGALTFFCSNARGASPVAIVGDGIFHSTGP